MKSACVSFLLGLVSVESLCSCGLVYVGRARDRELCNDIEARDECVHANDEVTDMINSLGRNADLYLMGKIENEGMTAKDASLFRTSLSYAIELEKPVGDCSNGLATNTLLNGQVKSHCFSVELQQQCARIRNTVDAYVLRIPLILSDYLEGIIGSYNDTDSAAIGADMAEFVEAMTERTDISTANIRCASHAATADDISGASFSRGAQKGLLPTGVLVAVAVVLPILWM